MPAKTTEAQDADNAALFAAILSTCRPSYSVAQLLDEALPVGLTRFYELVNAGELRMSKIGGRSVVLGADLARFLAAQRDRLGFTRKPPVPSGPRKGAGPRKRAARGEKTR